MLFPLGLPPLKVDNALTDSAEITNLFQTGKSFHCEYFKRSAKINLEHTFTSFRLCEYKFVRE